MEDPQRIVLEVTPESPWVRVFRGTAIASIGATAVLVAAGFVLSPWAAYGAISSFVAIATLTMALAASLCAFGAYSMRRERLPGPTTTLNATPSGVTLGMTKLRASELETGTIRPRNEFYELELTRKRGPPLRVQTHDREGARRVLDLLGVGAGSQVMTRKVTSRVNTPWVVVPVMLFATFSLPVAGLIAGWTGSAVALALPSLSPLLVLATMALGLIKTRVSIGADAVAVSWLGMSRSVALTDITDVTVTKFSLVWPRYVRLARRDGSTFDIAVGSRGHHVFEPFSLEEECSLIAERVQDAIQRAGEKQRSVSTALETWMAERSASPAAAWLRELRDRTAASYRDTALPLSEADLLEVLEDPNGAPILRAAAAAVLASQEGGTIRARIRAAADNTAVPRLRVALVAASEGDDDELADRLRALEEDARETQAAALKRLGVRRS